jgi:beta-barrel assembly-enhancing protease
MQKSILLALLLLGTSVLSTAQQGPIQSNGPIPEEFRTLTATKVQAAQTKAARKERNEREKKRINEFILKNNFVIDELLQSGKILFGDSLTEYVNEVAQFLLSDDEELRSELQFFVMKSNEVNAFATNQGIIFVTVGLLSQLENEGQLAAVLSHEVAHYEKEHSINKVLENDRVSDQARTERYGRRDSRMKLLSAFSRDMEFEADSLGFERLVKKGYDKQTALSILDVLQFKMLPIDDIEFDETYLTLGLTTIPQSVKIDSLSPIPLFDDDDDDSESTHPNISKRRSRIMELTDTNPSKGKKYMLGKDRFTRIRRLAQYECIILDLAAQQFVDAFYNAYVLAKKEGDNQTLNEFRAKALYGITKYKNAGDLGDVAPTSEDVYSNVQGVYYFFENVSKKECNLFVVRHLWETYEKYKSPFIGKLLDDAIVELINKHKFEYGDLLTNLNKLVNLSNPKEESTTAASSTPSATSEEDDEDEEESKYDKLRAKKEKALQSTLNGDDKEGWHERREMEEEWEDYFASQMYIKMNRADLKAKFDAQEIVAKERKKKEEEEEEEDKTAYQKNSDKEDLDISKAIFVDPFYVAYDYRKGLLLMEAEEQNIALKDQISKSANTTGLDQQTLMTKKMEADQIMDYNTMSLMNGWVQEHLAHTGSKIKMIPLMTDYTRSLEAQYGTNKFVYTGVVSLTEGRNTERLWATTCFIPVLLPIAISMELMPKRSTEIYFLVFDVSEGSTVYSSDKATTGQTNEMRIIQELTKQMKRIL